MQYDPIIIKLLIIMLSQFSFVIHQFMSPSCPGSSASHFYLKHYHFIFTSHVFLPLIIIFSSLDYVHGFLGNYVQVQESFDRQIRYLKCDIEVCSIYIFIKLQFYIF